MSELYIKVSGSYHDCGAKNKAIRSNNLCWVLAIGVALLASQTANANKEMPRTLEEMYSRSLFVLDGEIVKTELKQATKLPHTIGTPIVSQDYETTFKITRKIKGDVQSETVILIYSRVEDPRLKGDVPPLLKLNDRFRLYAKTVENPGPPLTIRIHTANQVRPEGFDKQDTASINKTPLKVSTDLPTAMPIIGNTDTNSELLEKLKIVNILLTDRMVDPASPEGIFLDSLPNKKPFSPDVLNQLTLMVDIKEKVPRTKEQPSITELRHALEH